MVGIGLFAPLPLAIMIPFMAGQSFAMGEAFGKGFQFGKRKISSMTNEEFNKLTAQEAFAETTADIKSMIPTMSKGMNDFHTLQTDIILRMIDYIAKLPADVGPQLLESLVTPISNPNAIFKWEEIINGVIQFFDNRDATIKFLEQQGFSAAATNASPITSTAFERLRFIALQLNQGTTGTQGPAPGPETQQQILDRTGTYFEYRREGGLLLEDKWKLAKHGLFPTTQTSLQQRIQEAVNVTGKLIRGATAKRRRTTSSDLKKDVFQKAISQLIPLIHRAKTEAVRKAQLSQLRSLAQNLADHIFTYI